MQKSDAERLWQMKAEWAKIKCDFAALKFMFAAAHLREVWWPEEKYRPDQPRVPAGSSDGGQWTLDGAGGGIGNDVLAGGDGNDLLAPSQALKPYTVNLVEEDARGGHAFRDHVAKTDGELISTVKQKVLRGGNVDIYFASQSSYLSLESANDFTNRILQENQTTVDAVSKGVLPDAWLDKRFGYPTGKEAFRDSASTEPYVRTTYGAGVYIVHDRPPGRGYRVHTSYPYNERPE